LIFAAWLVVANPQMQQLYKTHKARQTADNISRQRIIEAVGILQQTQ
jgi:hypothetical protein